MGTRLAVLLVAWSLPFAVMGEDLTTMTGQTYSNIVVRRYDHKGIFIDCDGGGVKIFYREILPELRGYYKKMALDPTPETKKPGEKEDPAGSNDLATLSGPIYRNVVVKKVDEYAITIAHDGGSAKVYFSEIPQADREKYRTASPVPDTPPSTNDLATDDGQVFRNVEILLTEPDGLTFRHAGGVTKLRFPSLSKELKERYGYDYDVARKYQRAQAAEKRRAQAEAEERRKQEAARPPAPASTQPIALFEVKADELQGSYRIRFGVRNLTDRTQSIRAIPYDAKKSAVMGGKKFEVPPNPDGERLEILVPIVKPRTLTVYCGAYQTNRTLRW